MITVASSAGICHLESIKHAPPIIGLKHRFQAAPSTCAASCATVFAAQGTLLSSYDSTGQFVPRYTAEGKITCIACDEAGGNIFVAAGTQIVVLSPDTSTVVSRIDVALSISGICLSSDATLLLAYNDKKASICHLQLGTQTELRLPSSVRSISACAIQGRTKPRLYICAGMQLIVYDISKSQSPTKVIKMPGVDSVVGLSACPASKTLVAVATVGGHLLVVDTDKDTSILRKIDLKTTLTAITFSPKGSAIITGTKTGKLFMVDLRALDKTPKCVEAEGGAEIRWLLTKMIDKTAVDAAQFAITTASSTHLSSASHVQGARARNSSTSSAVRSKTMDTDNHVDHERDSIPTSIPSQRASVRSKSSSALASTSTRREAASTAPTTVPSRRTPSPELSDIDDDGASAIAQDRKRAGMFSHTLHTPPSGKAKVSKVKKTRHSAVSDAKRIDETADGLSTRVEGLEISVHVSPQRSKSSNKIANNDGIQHFGSQGNMQAVLRSMINDALYEHQRSSQADMTGLHLDLIKLGRTLRKEIRENSGTAAAAELDKLRSENARLREENERLRRGY